MHIFKIYILSVSIGYSVQDIASIGITNQRETTIVWDKLTGVPLYNAIVWNDIRTDETVDKLLARLPDQNKDHFKSISGLTISPYFSALKLRWLKDNIPDVRKACRDGRCLAGTVDSWLIWVSIFGPNNYSFSKRFQFKYELSESRMILMCL